MAATKEAVLRALGTVQDPDRGKDIVRLDMVRDLIVRHGLVSFTIVLKDPSRPFAKEVEALAREAVQQEVGEKTEVRVKLDNEMIALGDSLTMDGAGKSAPEVKVPRIIAVASGKGGVGKSTVAANLAVSLAKQGYDVGLVDADIYGPSVPTMFGVADERPRVNEERKLIPIERHGVRLLSMGFLVEPDRAVIWRGPMVSGAIKQFLGEVAWGELDFLVLDLPPGTGDIQLTIVQTVSLSGAVIVSTPQEVALADARKGVAMFRQVNVPVLGIVENMAYFTPPDLPERKYHLFGEGGARRLAEQLDVPFLGEVPIEQALRESGDAGTPMVAAHPESLSAGAFADIARATAEQVALLDAERVAEPVQIEYR